MAQEVGDHAGGDALLQEDGGGGVPEVMEADLWQAGDLQDVLMGAADGFTRARFGSLARGGRNPKITP